MSLNRNISTYYFNSENHEITIEYLFDIQKLLGCCCFTDYKVEVESILNSHSRARMLQYDLSHDQQIEIMQIYNLVNKDIALILQKKMND